MRHRKLLILGLEQQGFGFLGQYAGSTAGLHLDGRVFEVGLLARMSSVDRHGVLDVVGADLDDGAVKLDRNGQRQAETDQHEVLTRFMWQACHEAPLFVPGTWTNDLQRA